MSAWSLRRPSGVLVLVGLIAVALAALVALLGRPGAKPDRVAAEEPGEVGDAPAWQREYGPEELDPEQLDGAGELQRLHVVSYVDGDLDRVVLDDEREAERPVERGCGRETVRNSSFEAPSGRMSVSESFPLTVDGADHVAPEDVAQQIGMEDAGPHRFGVEHEVEVEADHRVEVRAHPLEERWAFRLAEAGGDGASSRGGDLTRVVGLCFAIWRLA